MIKIFALILLSFMIYSCSDLDVKNIECKKDTDCPSDAVCIIKNCELKKNLECIDDKDCRNDEFCTEEGKCEDNTCIADENCYDGEYCNYDNLCIEYCDDTTNPCKKNEFCTEDGKCEKSVDCTIDEIKCSDDNKGIKKCNSTGDAWDLIGCPDGKECSDVGPMDAQCVLIACVVGQIKCSNDKRAVETCIADGLNSTKWNGIACDSGLQCNPDTKTCEGETFCEPRAIRCNPDQEAIDTCNVDGSAWVTDSCTAGKICVGTGANTECIVPECRNDDNCGINERCDTALGKCINLCRDIPITCEGSANTEELGQCALTTTGNSNGELRAECICDADFMEVVSGAGDTKLKCLPKDGACTNVFCGHRGTCRIEDETSYRCVCDWGYENIDSDSTKECIRESSNFECNETDNNYCSRNYIHTHCKLDGNKAFCKCDINYELDKPFTWPQEGDAPICIKSSCSTHGDCGGARPYCDTINGDKCVECLSDDNCGGARPYCDISSGSKCIECSEEYPICEYTGDYCNIILKECETGNCNETCAQHAVCVFRNSSQECVCEEGYTFINNECRKLKIFVTEKKYDGNMGGISGVDAKCNNDAHTPTDNRYYKALILAPNRNKESHDWPLLSNTTYYRVSGEKIGVTIINDAIFSIPLSLGVTDDIHDVWTASKDGSYTNSDNCSVWNSNSTTASGKIGLSSSTDSHFIANGSSYCNTEHELYCVEQICSKNKLWNVDLGACTECITLYDCLYGQSCANGFCTSSGK